MSKKSEIVTPHAGVIIWNYEDRIGSEGTDKAHKIQQTIINTASLVSIKTNKSKSRPAGNFEFELAPTFNWVSRITPGSWCAILASRTVPIPKQSNKKVKKADQRTLKMLGRIDSVRAVVDVDQQTGTRMTRFVVAGRDWGSVFDTKLYIDPIYRNNNVDKDGFIATAMRMVYEDMILEWDFGQDVPSTSQTCKAIINFWGAPLAKIAPKIEAKLAKLSQDENIKPPLKVQIAPTGQFKLPDEVAEFMHTDLTNFGGSNETNGLITLIDGRLVDYDTYSGDLDESQGFIDPMSLFTINSFWELLQDNCNNVLNELVTDLVWHDDWSVSKLGIESSFTKPTFGLYKRVKPFVNRNEHLIEIEAAKESPLDTPIVSDLISSFKNVKYNDIPLEDVISFNAGTNWQEKINFIEVRPTPQLIKNELSVATKFDQQTIDKKAYEREGFKPMIVPVKHLDLRKHGEQALFKCTAWKHLLREWYFNTHVLLNGAVSFIGQDDYIQVGQNIRIPVQVFGDGAFSLSDTIARQLNQDVYFLAHVESISHQISINPNGARKFITTVQFVRGIVVDSDNTMINQLNIKDGGTLNKMASVLPDENRKNDATFTRSTEADWDIQTAGKGSKFPKGKK